MGCVLGPTFSNFYMGDLERKVFKKNKFMKPKTYIRYMDDTFGSFRSEK